MIHIDEGKQWSLQVHDQKRESWFLASGSLILLLENSEGTMEEIVLKQGEGFTCALGQKHRMKGGVGGGDVFEVSTPETGNTYRLEDDYSRETETEKAREERNRNAS
jgi:mannose-6-phosphate isomerase-like protein (cupin superfamily)